MIPYLIVSGIAAVVLVKMGIDILNGFKSRNWPTVQGTIQQSGMEAHQSRDDDGDIRTTYGASVLYTYEVMGQEFRGDRRTFSNVRTSSARNTQKILDRYPPGTTVSVYYDPEDPSSSVLEPGVGVLTYILLLVALAFLGFGIAGVFGLIG